MAWTYYCADEALTLVADTKEALAQVVKDHINTAHDMHMTDDEAMQAVNENARQQAA